MKILYHASKSAISNPSQSRYEEYKKKLKRNIEKQFPGAEVRVVDSGSDVQTLDIDFEGAEGGMTEFDRIRDIAKKVNY